MTRAHLARRFCWALLIAALLALTIHRLNATEQEWDEDLCRSDEEQCRIVFQYPDVCAFFEPWTYWWGFFGCENASLMAAEGLVPSGSVVITTLGRDYVLIEVEIVHPVTGEVQRDARVVRRKGRR